VKLIILWNVFSSRLDQLLAAGCSHCDGPTSRLTQHRAGARGNEPQSPTEGPPHADIARRASAGFPEVSAAGAA
jgi:hypothetical protein